MTTFEESQFLAWLLKQPETTRGTIEASLAQCRMDVDALDYFLGRAVAKLPKSKGMAK